MGQLGFQVRGQIDDVDGDKGALFHADAAPDAQFLGDECNFA